MSSVMPRGSARLFDGLSVLIAEATDWFRSAPVILVDEGGEAAPFRAGARPLVLTNSKSRRCPTEVQVVRRGVGRPGALDPAWSKCVRRTHAALRCHRSPARSPGPLGHRPCSMAPRADGPVPKSYLRAGSQPHGDVAGPSPSRLALKSAPSRGYVATGKRRAKGKHEDLGACLGEKHVGKPRTGKPYARFDEGGQAIVPMDLRAQDACSLTLP
jgi:hypothetical protein